MKFLLFTLIILAINSTFIPISPKSQRCIFIYSQEQDDTIKLEVKFPKNPAIEASYDYLIELQDIEGNVLSNENVTNYIYKNEVVVPHGDIDQVCIMISQKQGSNASLPQFFQDILVQYHANIHFMATDFKMPGVIKGMVYEQIDELTKEAQNILNLTSTFISYQNQQKIEQTREFEKKAQIQSSFYMWVVFQLLAILLIGLYQWSKIKTKIQAKRDQ